MYAKMLISVLVFFSSLLFTCAAIPGRVARSVNGSTDQTSHILRELNSLRQQTTKTLERLQALENKADKDFSFLFPKKSATDHVLIRGMPYLLAVTVCFWMRSGDQDTSGTPFSYAVSRTDNELTLYNYKDFVLIVGESRSSSSSVSANDGLWHHICFTWESRAGSWYIYKDGSLQKTGWGLNKGHVIQAGGILVLGQDQDSLGGGFSAAQSFVGLMSDVNVWNRVLHARDISKLSKSCLTGEGNVLKWSDFKSGGRATTTVIQPAFCGP